MNTGQQHQDPKDKATRAHARPGEPRWQALSPGRRAAGGRRVQARAASGELADGERLRQPTGDGRPVDRAASPSAAAPQDPARRAGQRKRLRNIGVDVARGVALVGMIANHTFPEALDNGAQTFAQMFAGGRASAAFAVMAGVGIALLSGAVRPVAGRARTGVRAGLLARGLGLVAIGLALGYADSGLAVILAYFGLYFIFAIPLVGMRPRALFATAIAIAIVVPVVFHFISGAFPVPEYDSPTFGTLIHDPLGLLAALTITGEFPAIPWMALIAAGIAAGRLNLSSARVAGRLLLGGLALAGSAWIISSLLLHPLGGLHALLSQGPNHGMAPQDVITTAERDGHGLLPMWSWWWLAVRGPHSSAPFDLLHVMGTSLALLGAMLLLTRPTLVARALRPLALAGSMTLTIYSAHVLLMSTDLLDEHLTTLLGLQIAAALVFAVAWRRKFTRGPLESLLHIAAQWARGVVTERTEHPGRARTIVVGARSRLARPKPRAVAAAAESGGSEGGA